MPKPLILALPVDSAWAFVGLDIHFIVIHINLGNVHFKVVGQELDGLPNSSYPRPTWRLEYLLQGGQVCACSCKERTGQEGWEDRQTMQSQCSASLHPNQEVSSLLLLAGGGGGRIWTSTAGNRFPGHHLASDGPSQAVQGQCQALCSAVPCGCQTILQHRIPALP